MKGLGALLGALAMALLLPTVAGVTLPSTTAHCAAVAPPCGYIFPTIILTSPVTSMIWLNETMTIPLDITFEWNFDNDATGIDDPGNPITLTFDAPKKPNWVEWSVEPQQIVLQAPEFNPFTTYSYHKTATVTLTPKDSIAEADRTGSKMLFFVQSSESGQFKRSYGVEVWRFPSDDGALGANGTDQTGALPTVGATGSLLAFAGALAAVTFLARRKR